MAISKRIHQQSLYMYTPLFHLFKATKQTLLTQSKNGEQKLHRFPGFRFTHYTNRPHITDVPILEAPLLPVTIYRCWEDVGLFTSRLWSQPPKTTHSVLTEAYTHKHLSTRTARVVLFLDPNRLKWSTQPVNKNHVAQSDSLPYGLLFIYIYVTLL